jgi:hypothetical protein
VPRKPIGETAMTDAERQARYRAARAADAPVIRTRRPADHRSRARRWHDAVAELVALQVENEAWLEALPRRSRTRRPPKRSEPFASSTSPTFRRSNRPEGSAGIDAAGINVADPLASINNSLFTTQKQRSGRTSNLTATRD